MNKKHRKNMKLHEENIKNKKQRIPKFHNHQHRKSRKTTKGDNKKKDFMTKEHARNLTQNKIKQKVKRNLAS